MNNLYIVTLIRWSFELGIPNKVYLVYETTKNGSVIQKHGQDSSGEPFPSIEMARQWMIKKKQSSYSFSEKILQLSGLSINTHDA